MNFEDILPPPKFQRKSSTRMQPISRVLTTNENIEIQTQKENSRKKIQKGQAGTKVLQKNNFQSLNLNYKFIMIPSVQTAVNSIKTQSLSGINVLYAIAGFAKTVLALKNALNVNKIH